MSNRAVALKDYPVAGIQPSVTSAVLKQKQAEMLKTASDNPLIHAAEHDDRFQGFLRAGNFTPEYEAHIRVITNPNGRGNAAFDMDKERAMPPQDKLVRVWGWFHGNTGFSCMFRWASGRQDAYVVLDNPNPSAEALANQTAQIEAFREHIKLAKENAHAANN